MNESINEQNEKQTDNPASESRDGSNATSSRKCHGHDCRNHKGRRRHRGVWHFLLAAIAIVTLAKAGWAIAGPGKHGFVKHFAEKALNEVDASEEQKAQIHAILDREKSKWTGQKDEMRAMHEGMLDVLAAPSIDKAALESFRAQTVTTFEAKSKEMMNVALEVAQVLTPEQRAELVAEMREHHKRREMKGPGHMRDSHRPDFDDNDMDEPSADDE